jgi:DNA-binding SARP family transcriptional activator
VLGRTTVESVEGSIGGSWLERRPGQLLKYLIAERERPAPSDEIAAALWPGKGAEALNTVRHYIHVLREKLEPGRAKRSQSTFVVAAPSGYFIDRLRVGIDADLFEDKARTGIASYLNDEQTAGAQRLEEAMGLYGGDFIADEPYAEWSLFERDRLRALASQACRALIEHRARLGDLEAAAAHGERLAELEPYDTDVHRAVLTIALKRGRRSEAVRRYGIARQRMIQEFREGLPFDLADLVKTRDQPISLM